MAIKDKDYYKTREEAEKNRNNGSIYYVAHKGYYVIPKQKKKGRQISFSIPNYMQLLFIFIMFIFLIVGSFTKEIFIMSLIVNGILLIVAIDNSLNS